MTKNTLKDAILQKLRINCGCTPQQAGDGDMLRACAMVLRDVMAERNVTTREETDKERAKREARAAKMMASRERMLQQQQQYEKSKSGGSGKKNQSAKKPEKKAGTNENGRVGQRPYARGRAYNEHHYDE